MSVELNTQRLNTAVLLQEQTTLSRAAANVGDVLEMEPSKTGEQSEHAELISKTAHALQALFMKISSMPEVDESRVAAAKEKLARGEIGLLSSQASNVLESARNIADKMISFESAFIKER